MNFNTSLYSNALGGISEEFNVSEQAARCWCYDLSGSLRFWL